MRTIFIVFAVASTAIRGAATCAPPNLQVDFEGQCYACDELYTLAVSRCDVYDTVPTNWPPEKYDATTDSNVTCTPYVCVEPDYMLHCAAPERLPSSNASENYITVHVVDADAANERIKLRPFINWNSPHLYYNKPGYDYGDGLGYVSSWINTLVTMNYPYVELDDHDHCVFRMNRQGEFEEQWQDLNCFNSTVDGNNMVVDFHMALTICYTNLDEAACESQSYAYYENDVPVSWQRPAYRAPYTWNKVWYGHTEGHVSLCMRNWQTTHVEIIDGTVDSLSDSVTIDSVSIIDPDESPLVIHDDVITIGPAYNVTLDSDDFDMSFEHLNAEGVWTTLAMSNAVHYLHQAEFYRIIVGDRYRFSLSVRNKAMFSEDNLRDAIAERFVSASITYEWQYDEYFNGTFVAGNRYTVTSHRVEALSVNDFVVETSFVNNMPYFVEDSMRLVVFIDWHKPAESGRRLSVEYQPSWGKENGAVMVYGYTALPDDATSAPTVSETEEPEPSKETHADYHNSVIEPDEDDDTSTAFMIAVFVFVSAVFFCCGLSLLRWDGRVYHQRHVLRSYDATESLLPKRRQGTLAYKNIHMGVVVADQNNKARPRR